MAKAQRRARAPKARRITASSPSSNPTPSRPVRRALEPWYWVEGLRAGLWYPLYCAAGPERARRVLSYVLDRSEDPTSREELNVYEDFHIKDPNADQ